MPNEKKYPSLNEFLESYFELKNDDPVRDGLNIKGCKKEILEDSIQAFVNPETKRGIDPRVPKIFQDYVWAKTTETPEAQEFANMVESVVILDIYANGRDFYKDFVYDRLVNGFKDKAADICEVFLQLVKNGKIKKFETEYKLLSLLKQTKLLGGGYINIRHDNKCYYYVDYSEVASNFSPTLYLDLLRTTAIQRDSNEKDLAEYIGWLESEAFQPTNPKVYNFFFETVNDAGLMKSMVDEIFEMIKEHEDRIDDRVLTEFDKDFPNIKKLKQIQPAYLIFAAEKFIELCERLEKRFGVEMLPDGARENLARLKAKYSSKTWGSNLENMQLGTYIRNCADSAEQQLGRQQTEINSLTADNESLKTRVTDLEAQVQGLTTENASLNQQVAILNAVRDLLSSASERADGSAFRRGHDLADMIAQMKQKLEEPIKK